VKLALIPPFAFAGDMLLSNYQLVLPECFRSDVYTAKVYAMRAQGRSDFIMLDNGAAEGNAWHPQALQAIAREFKVDEIVVPDMLGEKDGTLDLLEQYEKELTPDELREFRHMGVPQGQTEIEFMACIDAFAEKMWIDTIGVPRHMLQTLGNKFARVRLANWIIQRHPGRFKVHYLGSSAQMLNEAKMLQVATPWARGMDTSMPYYAAFHGIDISEPDPPIIARPENYFERAAFEFGRAYLEANLMTLKGWLH